MLLPNLSFTTCARRKGSAPRGPRIQRRSLARGHRKTKERE
jgi:hypothetical protein